MAEILWTPWQEEHITDRHGVTAEQFDEAWHRRSDMSEKEHEEHGPYTVSIGWTDDGQVLEMLWRWQGQAPEGEIAQMVWPITAYFIQEER